MSETRRLQILSVILFVLVAVAVVVWGRFHHPPRPAPTAPGYYTGVMRSKGDPNVYATEDGRVVPPPPGTRPADASAGRPNMGSGASPGAH